MLSFQNVSRVREMIAAPFDRLTLIFALCFVWLGPAGFARLGGVAEAAGPAAVALDQLMVADALPDIVQGASDAPVTIIEYASMTCTHCAAFHTTTYQELKRKYIDTGKVRFILREFPLDQRAAAAFMLARCAGDDKRTAMVDFLFAQQKTWAFADKPVEALANLVKQTGMSEAAFKACLSDTELYKKVLAIHDRAENIFAIRATPTFFINGKREDGELTIEALDKIIEPLLKG
jgi:protein-disulfide isomerase